MATITLKPVIMSLLQDGGRFQDDPVVVIMYDYTAPINGKRCVAIYYTEHYMGPEFDPVILMHRGILTIEGETYLADLENNNVIQEG